MSKDQKPKISNQSKQKSFRPVLNSNNNPSSFKKFTYQALRQQQEINLNKKETKEIEESKKEENKIEDKKEDDDDDMFNANIHPNLSSEEDESEPKDQDENLLTDKLNKYSKNVLSKQSLASEKTHLDYSNILKKYYHKYTNIELDEKKMEKIEKMKNVLIEIEEIKNEIENKKKKITELQYSLKNKENEEVKSERKCIVQKYINSERDIKFKEIILKIKNKISEERYKLKNQN